MKATTRKRRFRTRAAPGLGTTPAAAEDFLAADIRVEVDIRVEATPVEVIRAAVTPEEATQEAAIADGARRPMKDWNKRFALRCH